MTTERMPAARVVPRRSVINGDPSQIVGPPWTAGLYYFALLAAAAVDIVTFHQVLTAAIDEDRLTLWLLAVGFTVVCLVLSHTVGQQSKQSVETRHVVGARTAALLFLVGWFVLGLVAFLVRWNFVDPGGGAGFTIVVDGHAVPPPDTGAEERHLSAWLFAALYVASGLVSGYSGYKRYHPAARQYMRALARRTKAAKKLGDLSADLAEITQLVADVNEAKARRVEAWHGLQAQCEAAAERLKNDTRLALIQKTAGRRQLDGRSADSGEEGR
ncbi:hypothetical protein [Actinocrispum wychmicini]|uniref:Uncharacterized protein n=1 Tax=Actinocrispum wychmicini TaxID=1213861 RepID=A0A4R2JF99_9PSEU|nr:hypothetical protein [Actinocrispum wychmicini]TCO52915.1 hypothetical protein EV192_111109 [Actinocrispum wychmicini]